MILRAQLKWITKAGSQCDSVATRGPHPGDPGWFWRFGAEVAAAAIRTWSRDEQILAVGLLDDPESTLFRLTLAPDAPRDEELAQQLVKDVTERERGVLVTGRVRVEAPAGALVQKLLTPTQATLRLGYARFEDRVDRWGRAERGDGQIPAARMGCGRD
jgi:hypothetical protein